MNSKKKFETDLWSVRHSEFPTHLQTNTFWRQKNWGGKSRYGQ